MIKKAELTDPMSCLNQAQDDEPVFVLRANDELAPGTIRFWIDWSHQQGKHLSKLAEAEALAQKMEAWKREQKV